jgi:hypothetical protein
MAKLGANPWADYRQVVTLVACLFGQIHAAAALFPGKTRYPLNTRLDGPQSRSRRVRKITPPPHTHTEIRSPDSPVRSEPLYRLSYSDRRFNPIPNIIRAIIARKGILDSV